MNELSKYLCLLLRHQPEKAELDMDEHGWVSVEQLIDGVNRHSSYKLDRELLEQIVAEDNKGRYRFDEKHEKIKCCQGHSVPWVEPELEYCEPPEFLYHGTTTKALEAIEESGAIKKMKRHAVHMQADISKAWQSAERWHKTPVVLKIAAAEIDHIEPYFAVKEVCRHLRKTKVDYWMEDAFATLLTYNVWNEIIKSFSKINNLEVSDPNPSETDLRKEAFIHRLLKNAEISKPEDVDYYLTPKNLIKLINKSKLIF